MKMIFISFALSLCCLLSCSRAVEKNNTTKATEKAKEYTDGNKPDVPEAVKAKLAAMYPNAGATDWKMYDGKYEATFTQDRMVTTVYITIDGTILKYEVKIDASLLPQSITDYVVAQLGGKKITGATKITDPKGRASYEVELDKEKYLFTDKGMFVGKENMDEGEGEHKN